jgi:hypothetical protein
VEFRVPAVSPDVIYKRFDDLLQEAKKRPFWGDIFDPGDHVKIRGDALNLCAASADTLILSVQVTTFSYRFAAEVLDSLASSKERDEII